MKNGSLLLAATLGLGAGVIMGWRPSAPVISPPKQTRQFQQNSGAAPGRLDTANAFSNDPRIIRLFSAALEPVGLLRRFEYAEALRDLTAQDMPALIKHVEGLPQDTRDELLPILMGRWFELDSKAAAAWPGRIRGLMGSRPWFGQIRRRQFATPWRSPADSAHSKCSTKRFFNLLEAITAPASPS